VKRVGFGANEEKLLIISDCTYLIKPQEAPIYSRILIHGQLLIVREAGQLNLRDGIYPKRCHG